jgi:hypothetical protein
VAAADFARITIMLDPDRPAMIRFALDRFVKKRTKWIVALYADN